MKVVGVLFTIALLIITVGSILSLQAYVPMDQKAYFNLALMPVGVIFGYIIMEIINS